MKKRIFALMSILFLISSTRIFAASNCTTNAAGDTACVDAKNPNVIYTTLSASSLSQRVAQIAPMLNQQNAQMQQQKLNNEALQNVINKEIANNPALQAEKSAINN